LSYTPEEIQRLALFPEQNPNPVMEIDMDKGLLSYINSAGRNHFTENVEVIKDSALFSEIYKRAERRIDFVAEIIVNERIYEQKVYFLKSSTLVRIYLNDITERKKIEKNLMRLASFPEQNPSPIVEFNLKGEIEYSNPATLIAFPEFYMEREKHIVLDSFHANKDKFINGAITQLNSELLHNGKHYDQRMKFLPENNLIRMFIIDITEQKRIAAIIERKNRDITDSINYARKIQDALLPEGGEAAQFFRDQFEFYLPKDIVSGDFYWFDKTEEHFIAACADCTGHGVPGAMMSMLGVNFLSQIVNDSNVRSPEDALGILDRKITRMLRQENEKTETRDGMDIALFAVDKKTKTLNYSGANRPLVMIRDGQLTEFSANKFPIGGTAVPGGKNFKGHQIDLQEGDCFYLFTDGYADQFGGPHGKKYMRKRFLGLLTEIHQLPMPEQKSRIQGEFEQWKDKTEQVDDVLVIGFRY
jgi:serine phosphatase RsbU (regulator of sigma subunit)